jgi:hypothetical protein
MPEPADPNNGNGTDSWRVWCKHVLAELERQNRALEEANTKIARLETLLVEGLAQTRLQMSQEIGKVNTSIGMLQVKSSAWGAASGLATALVAFLATKG